MTSTASVSSTGAAVRIAPGPAPQFLIGNLAEFRKNALNFMMKLSREYGGVVRFQLGKKIAHLVSDPAGAKYVLQDNYKNYRKGKPYGRARYVFGEGLITSDG